MNIFKTLASGSGSINEPNVSAFLGFLLNPKEDHGLGDAFLTKFLEPLLAENDNLDFMRNRNLSIHSNFEFEVLLEQAFKDEKDKNNKGNQIVDIVILCYEKESQQGRFLAEDIIKQKKIEVSKPKHIFLIENKIKDESCTKGQLEEQYRKTIKKLESLEIDKPEGLVSVIFLTPDEKKCNDEFSRFNSTSNKVNKLHLFWHVKNNDSTPTKKDIYVSEIIREIIEKVSKPIDAYCKYTLQAFLEFIENDFKSTIKEDLERKREYPKFKYKGGEYSRPLLAEKIISDYISDYEKENNEKITLAKLKEKFPFEKTTKSKTYPPFAEKEYAKDARSKRQKDGSLIRYFYYYYPRPIQIADTEIFVRNGWEDDTLLSLLNIVGLKFNDEKEVSDINNKL